MLAAPLSINATDKNGPRPIDLPRDARQVVQLLDIVFGPLLNSQGQRHLGDRVNFDYNVPFLNRLNILSASNVPGFVWQENERIVGNVSLIRSQLPGRFLIANVAVHPDYRRRGIGRTLMAVAIEHVELRDGQEIFLQVRDDNDGAADLYYKLGFSGIGSVKNWYATTSRLTLRREPSSAGYPLRPLKKHEWQSALALDRSSVQPDLNWPVPINSAKYQRGLLKRFEEFANGIRREIWIKDVTGADHERKFIAGLVNIWSEWGRGMKLELRVHPKFQGSIEPALIFGGLNRLKTWKNGTIRIRHPANDEAANEFFTQMRFNESPSLLVMKLKLR